MAKHEKPHWQVLHEQAVAEGKMCYLDPELGYSVFTASHHLDRGFCCESGCRHCPYGFLLGKNPTRKKEGVEE